MMFKLLFTPEADCHMQQLQADPAQAKRLKAVQKALAYLERNPRHPALNTHKYESLTRQFGIEVFTAYAQNQTPQAYRIFWHYGLRQTITIVAIVPHPQ